MISDQFLNSKPGSTAGRGAPVQPRGRGMPAGIAQRGRGGPVMPAGRGVAPIPGRGARPAMPVFKPPTI